MSVHDDTDDEFDFHDRDEVFNTTDEKDREKRRKHREEKELKENVEKASPDDQNLSSSEVRETIFKSPEKIDKAKKSNTAQQGEEKDDGDSMENQDILMKKKKAKKADDEASISSAGSAYSGLMKKKKAKKADDEASISSVGSAYSGFMTDEEGSVAPRMHVDVQLIMSFGRFSENDILAPTKMKNTIDGRVYDVKNQGLIYIKTLENNLGRRMVFRKNRETNQFYPMCTENKIRWMKSYSALQRAFKHFSICPY